MNFSIQSQSTENTKYKPAQLNSNCYYDPTKFDYSLVTSNGEKMLQNKRKKTDIVFLSDNKMQFYVNGSANVLYSDEFELNSSAAPRQSHLQNRKIIR